MIVQTQTTDPMDFTVHAADNKAPRLLTLCGVQLSLENLSPTSFGRDTTGLKCKECVKLFEGTMIEEEAEERLFDMNKGERLQFMRTVMEDLRGYMLVDLEREEEDDGREEVSTIEEIRPGQGVYFTWKTLDGQTFSLTLRSED